MYYLWIIVEEVTILGVATLHLPSAACKSLIEGAWWLWIELAGASVGCEAVCFTRDSEEAPNTQGTEQGREPGSRPRE